MLEARPAGAGYVDRTERPRPPIEEASTESKKLRFADIRKAWNELTEEEQEGYLKTGDWTVDPNAPKKKKKKGT